MILALLGPRRNLALLSQRHLLAYRYLVHTAAIVDSPPTTAVFEHQPSSDADTVVDNPATSSIMANTTREGTQDVNYYIRIGGAM